MTGLAVTGALGKDAGGVAGPVDTVGTTVLGAVTRGCTGVPLPVETWVLTSAAGVARDNGARGVWRDSSGRVGSVFEPNIRVGAEGCPMFSLCGVCVLLNAVGASAALGPSTLTGKTATLATANGCA